MTQSDWMEQAFALAKEVTDLYLTKRDASTLLARCDKNITWISGGADWVCHNIRDLYAMLEQEKHDFSGRYDIAEEWVCPFPLSDQSCLVFGHLRAVPQSGDSCLYPFRLRYTMLCIKEDEQPPRLIHVHMSLPNAEPGSGSTFPCRINQYDEREPATRAEWQTEDSQSDARYQFAMEALADVICEVDVATHTVYADQRKFLSFFGLKAGLEIDFHLLENLKEIIHPHDRERIRTTFRIDHLRTLLQEGHTVAKQEYRIQRREQEAGYFWIRSTVILVPDETGQLSRLICSIKNIDEQKSEEYKIRQRAQKDPLTGLDNKTYAIERIQQRLCSCEDQGCLSALMVIDVDNFKTVNDTLGHLLGDAVLCDVAKKIKSQCRGTDIVGRIGGDEFVVFLSGLPSREIIRNKADGLIEAFSRSAFGKNSEHKISGSIGIAVFPQDGLTYQALFSNADKALYAAKIDGKNRYRFFDAVMPERRYINKDESIPALAPGSEEFQDITHFIFRTLYEATNIDMAIDAILNIVGQKYQVSRAYVFENTPDDLACNNTFEWCLEGIEPEKQNLQNVPYASLENYPSNFDENGVFYCTDVSSLPPGLKDILQPQGIHSMLQCAIWEDGCFKGYVGFDECSGKRLWTQEEIRTLSLIAKMLSTFLMKERSQTRLLRAKQQLEKMLNQLDLWAYVIDPQTYRLLFLNEKTARIAPGSRVGSLCYKVLRGKDRPCADCPMMGLLKTGTDYTMEIFNDALQVWTRATAAYFEWSDCQQACLMYCLDITRYRDHE